MVLFLQSLEGDRGPLVRRIQVLEQELQACKQKVAAEEQDRMKTLMTLEKEVDTLRSSSNSIRKYAFLMRIVICY